MLVRVHALVGLREREQLPALDGEHRVGLGRDLAPFGDAGTVLFPTEAVDHGLVHKGVEFPPRLYGIAEGIFPEQGVGVSALVGIEGRGRVIGHFAPLIYPAFDGGPGRGLAGVNVGGKVKGHTVARVFEQALSLACGEVPLHGLAQIVNRAVDGGSVPVNGTMFSWHGGSYML